MKYLIAIVGVALAFSCVKKGPDANVGMFDSDKPIADAELSLLKGSVFDTYTPKGTVYTGGEEGSGKLLARSFPGAPPQIPHVVARDNSISLDGNDCMSCHNEGDDSALPASHKADHFMTVQVEEDEPAWRRQRCVMCHVQRSNAPPL